MGDLGLKQPDDWGGASSQLLTWICPEGHVFRFRRRPLLTSCLFIFCFFLLERAALYVLKTVLSRHLQRTLALSRDAPSMGYMFVSVFMGIYDSSPILIASMSDTYLGAFKSIVIFGFVFVFGLSLSVLVGGSWSGPAVGPPWCAMVALLGLIAISAGGLSPCLTAFGGAQFHPHAQTSGGSRFFSLIFISTSVGALLGIGTALMVLKSRPFGDLLLLSAGLGSAGWIFFILGSLFYVRRCVHTSAVKRMWRAAWSCLWRGSFSENKQSAGGEFSDAEIEDVRMTARLIPIFACLIPLYLGQVQVLTTLRTMGEKLVRPRSFGIHLFMPAELLLLFEPGTSLVVSLFLNYLLYPFLHKTRPRWMPSHLTRLTVGSVLVTLGFAVSFFIQRLLMTSSSRNYSIFILAFPVVLFSAGQTLITSSGFELSYAYAPASMWSVSISLFSLIYSLGSLVSVLLIYCMQGQLDRPVKRLDLYFAISAGLCLLSVIGLCCLRSFHARTREMRIERDIERRALEIALRRISVVAK